MNNLYKDESVKTEFMDKVNELDFTKDKQLFTFIEWCYYKIQLL